MQPQILKETKTYQLRRALPEDSSGLCELFRRVHMRGTLDVAQERDPDFFALPKMHLADYDVWCLENKQGTIGASGSVIVRPGYFDNAVRPVGYLSDLRILPGFKPGRSMPSSYKLCLEAARERLGAEVFYTVIFDSNQIAQKALLRPSDKRRKSQPIYSVMTPFEMTSVQFTRRKPKPSQPVRSAQERDVPQLVEFLANRNRARLMGEVFNEELLRKRLEHWPEFSLDNFLLRHDAKGNLVGVVAPWNTHSFKRTRVLGYYEHMKAVKTAFNLGAKILRYPPLPPAGSCFDFCFLSHLEVAGDDPQILRDLLLEAYGRLKSQGLHFMSAMIPQASRLKEAFRGFTVNRTPMTVYGVALRDSSFAEYDFRTQHPGFEMSLS